MRTNLAFQQDDLSCLTISSPEPSDGKTTILSNLGVAFAEIGKRTLLIDADLRKPGLSKLFGLKGKQGLSDLLRSNEDLDAITDRLILNSGLENMDVLPSGPRPHDPTGLLSRTRFSQFLNWAQDRYDQVLIDGTPILVASDAAIVGPYCRWLGAGHSA